MDDDMLLSDELMPSDGSLFAPELDSEVVQEANDQRNMVQTSYPVFDEVLAWFDTRIAWADRLAGINPESRQSIEAQVIAKQLLVNLLQEERGFLEALKATYSKS